MSFKINMAVIILCLCKWHFVVAAAPEAKRVFRYDYKYFSEPGGWFKLHRIPANWRDARLRCHLEGAILVSPLNKTLQEAMKAVMLNNELKDRAVFTGIHATFSNGDYSSVDGIPISRIPITWASGEPNNLNGLENCLVMYGNGTIADVECEGFYPYMCFKEDRGKPMTLTQCGTVDKGYKLHHNNICYKFHNKARVWAHAYMTCVAEGGHLAIIDSHEKLAIGKMLFGQYSAQDLKGTNKGIVYVGFHDWGYHGSWWTVHGETLEELNIKLWGHSQPDNLRESDEYCGSIFRNGELNDMPCNVKLSFICEKAPDSLL